MDLEVTKKVVFCLPIIGKIFFRIQLFTARRLPLNVKNQKIVISGSIEDNDEKILKSTISSETKLNLFIDQVIKKNNLKSNKIFLVGFSRGGMISLQAAVRRKK